MAERATIFQGVQIGLEAVPGTRVAASKKLGSMSFEPGISAEISKFRPMGTKFTTVTATNKEWSVLKASGLPTYTEIVYALSSIMAKVIPVGAGASKTWTFQMGSSAADAYATYSVEQGDATRAHRLAHALMDSFAFTFNRSETTLEGSLIGMAIEDGVVMTAGATSLDLIPILPSQVSVYLADDPVDLDAATALARPLSVNWFLNNRFGPLWALNASNSSFAAVVETEPSHGIKLTMEADAEGMGLLTNMRANSTKFIRLEAVGGLIEAGTNYQFTADHAVQIEDVQQWSDQDGVFSIEWDLAIVHDGGWGKSGVVTVVNNVAAL